MSQWHIVGRVRDAHGIQGEIFVALKARSADWLPDLETLGLGSDENFKGYEVEEARPHKQGLIVQLKGVSDRNQAESLRGQTVAIPEGYLEAEPGEAVFLRQLLGVQVVDHHQIALGQIVDFGFNGAQDLLVIENSKGRFDVPLVDDFIVDFSLAEKTLVMDLPEGLVEV